MRVTLATMAIALTACGGKARPQAGGDLGNEVAGGEPRLARSDCVAALPTPIEPGAVELTRYGATRGVCWILVHVDEEVFVTVLAVAHDGRRWQSRGTTVLSYRVVSSTEEFGAEENGSIEVYAVEIAPGEEALKVVLTRTSAEGDFNYATTTTELYRTDRGEELEWIFAMEAQVSHGEADDVTEKTLEVLEPRTQGFYDLEVQVFHNVTDWAAGEDEAVSESSVERYVWDGRTYVGA